MKTDIPGYILACKLHVFTKGVDIKLITRFATYESINLKDVFFRGWSVLHVRFFTIWKPFMTLIYVLHSGFKFALLAISALMMSRLRRDLMLTNFYRVARSRIDPSVWIHSPWCGHRLEYESYRSPNNSRARKTRSADAIKGDCSAIKIKWFAVGTS